jgi:Ni2+-binding GTPase involved in maturation of urease and hydrogenase
MKRVRYVMVGGFLGAGKTTTLARLARAYTGRGQKVGLVTNDQAADLVDTHSLRSQGFPVEEIAGACFCCRFDDLVDRVKALETNERPDVILAEPVGSCTDLVATVAQPLKDLYGNQFEVAPYAVLFKPSHGLRILRGQVGSGFSSKAEYIFRKQLEEADALVINRVDEMSAAEVDEVARLAAEQYPGVSVLKASAKTGLGFDALLELLDRKGDFGRRILDIDYDVYAEGEAELGWLNSAVVLESKNPFLLDALLLDVVGTLQTALRRRGAEVAHLKAISLADGPFGVANLVSSATKPELSLASRAEIDRADLIVNARVAMDPAELEVVVREAIAAACEKLGISASVGQTQSFRPGRPQPTHRYATAK